MRQLLTNVMESPEEILKKIRAVTQEEVQSIAQQLVLDGELRLAVIGPFKEQKMFEDILAS
jgi:predicted Zn-dependent peptidase